MRNDPRSHGLWEQSAPPAPPTGALSGTLDVDVVVVGAGFTGLSAALHLAQSGLSVAVLEAAEIGFGGSGRNVGLVNAGMWAHPHDVLERLGSEYGERLLVDLGAGPALVFDLVDKFGIACEPVRKGTLHLAVGEAGMNDIESRHAAWAARGAPVFLLDAAETARRVGSPAYSGALLDMRAGTIQPLAYARGLAAAAIAAGAKIFTGSPVAATHFENGSWTVSTPTGSATGRWVIAATNAYTSGLWPEIVSEIIPFPYFNFATEPLPAEVRASILAGGEGCWDTRTVLTSFRFDAAGRFVFGSVGALRNTGTTIHRSWAKRALRKLFPQVERVRFGSEWYGRIGMTANDLPRFHELAANVLSFSGYNGRGIAPGTVFGRALARHIASDRQAPLPLPLSPSSPVPFRQIKAAGIEAGAQFAHLVDSRM